MTGSRIFFDSSAWFTYFQKSRNEARHILEKADVLFTSSISIFEIKRKLIKRGVPGFNIKKIIEFINLRSIVIDLDNKICDSAAAISIKNNLHAVDALIYTSAQRKNAILVTSDSDFRKCDDVIILGE